MDQLEEIAEYIHADFEARTQARDKALATARMLTRRCAHTIRALHRNEIDTAQENLQEAARMVSDLQKNLADYPDLYYAGYTQDAFKEFAEASIFYAFVGNHEIPTPNTLGLESSTYLNGLAETIGEMRRRCLDILRTGYDEEAETLLSHMDNIYGVLVTMDYPNAITGGLRRLTDVMRGVIERTRGDMTMSLRQEHLENSLRALEKKIDS